MEGNAIATEAEVRAKAEAIVEEIRPILAMHRGDAEILSIKDGVVELKLKGSCDGCPMSIMTFGMALKEKMQEQIPEIKDVIWEGMEAEECAKPETPTV